MEPEFVNNITAYVDFSLNNQNESFPIFFDMDKGDASITTARRKAKGPYTKMWDPDEENVENTNSTLPFLVDSGISR